MVTSTPQEVSAAVDREMRGFSWVSQIDRDWFVAHRIEPQTILLAQDSDGTTWEEFWLITEHNGPDDSPYRVVFDDAHGAFGRECLLATNVPLYLGRFPSLEDAIDEIA